MCPDAEGSSVERRPSRTTCGWIGLGTIGLPLAARAAAAGWTVWAFDPSPARRDAARAAGIHVASSVEEVAAHAIGTVVCVVRTLAEVEAVLLGDGGVMRTEEPPLAVVMSSVGAVGLSEVAGRARKLGGEVVDAPILGNPAGATAGTLTILVSGPPDEVAAVRPLLDDLARSVEVLGDVVGLAQTVKMASQLRQIVGMLATIEGIELAVRRGADEPTVLQVLQATEPSWATSNWAYARGLWAGRDPSTSLGVFAKDLAAAVTDAQAAGLEVPLTREAHRLIEERLGDADDRGAESPETGRRAARFE